MEPVDVLRPLALGQVALRPGEREIELAVELPASPPRPVIRRLGTVASMPIDWDWTRVVFDHVKLTVRDAAASVAFYQAVLAELEIHRSGRASAARSSRTSSSSTASQAGRSRCLRRVDACPGRRVPPRRARGGRTRQRRSRCPRAVQLGRCCRYYAAFVLDPDGNNVPCASSRQTRGRARRRLPGPPAARARRRCCRAASAAG